MTKNRLSSYQLPVISFYCLLLTAYYLLFTVPAFAQNDGPTDDDVNAVAKQLYCPVCENTPLDVCPTQACTQWRATIREKLAAGWTEQQIKDYFVQQYGERVLAQPSTNGLNILIWVLPPLALLVGAFFLARYLQSVNAHRPAPASAPEPADDDLAAQLEKELAKRR
ncbi:MAG: cytochrome c-type biogenesis protein CcmH [Chloroflexi bacterium]|nr:cytochrome c-type biogenesis protein CcmH [Chloroflexota bacterium]